MTLSLLLKKNLATLAAFGFVLGGVIFSTHTASAATFFLPSDLPNARVGVRYTQEIISNHPGMSYNWARLGELPPGISGIVNSDGTAYKLDGVPTTAGSYTFHLSTTRRSDGSISDSPAQNLTLVVTPEPSGVPMEIYTPATLVNGRVGSAYSVDLLGIGGNAPYRWSVSYGTSLPPGLTLTTAPGTYVGELRGTPTTSGTYTFGVKFLDIYDNSTTKTFTVTINPRLVFTPPSGTIIDPPIVTPVTPPPSLPTPSLPISPLTPVVTTELTARLNALNRIGVSVHALVKLPDDGNRFTQADSAVYYIGADGRRHAFPNDRVFFTWYGNFDSVRVVSATDLASIPLGANATYRPGIKMVKFATDPKVYVVSNNRTLRWVNSEAAANALYGSNWNRQIDDVSDTFYLDYNFGTDVNAASDYNRTGLQSSIRFVSDTLPL